MINEIYIKDFKSYKEARLPLSHLTVLIGANASGKSNLLEAIRFLSWLSEGQKLKQLSSAYVKEEMNVRGDLSDFFRRFQKEFTLGLRFNKNLDFRSTIFQVGDIRAHLTAESIVNVISDDWMYNYENPYTGNDAIENVAFNDGKNDKQSFSYIADGQSSVFHQLEFLGKSLSSSRPNIKKRLEAISSLRQDLESIHFVEPKPSEMRGYTPMNTGDLTKSASNISGVLYRLINSDKELASEVTSFINILPERNISDIQFIETSRGDVMFSLFEETSGEFNVMDAPLLSDGTLRLLAYVVAILSAKDNSTIVIDEFDNGIHPSRFKEVLSYINKTSKAKNLNVLITCHNPALLDQVPDEAVEDIVFCYRDLEDGCSQLARLADLDNYPDIVLRDSIGALLTEGLLDRMVKHPETKEDRKEKASKWLDSLKTMTNE